MRRPMAALAATLVVVLLATPATGARGSVEAGARDAGSGVVLARIPSGQATASATLRDVRGDRVGSARFAQPGGGNEPVEIAVEIERGVEPGEHGLHVHETDDVAPDFEAAGGHFNPTGAQHGFDNPEGPHAGDLGNITVNEDGTASYETTTDRITLSEGERSILDSDGSALVVHARADDYETDPDGNAGDRVAAGAIESGTLTWPQVLLVSGMGALVVLFVGFVIWRIRRTAKTK